MNRPPASTPSMRARISSCSGSSGVFVSKRGTKRYTLDNGFRPPVACSAGSAIDLPATLQASFRRPSRWNLRQRPLGGPRMRRILAALAAATCLTLAAAGTAAAEPTWAPAATAHVHPGVMTFTEGAQCTSNFVFFDAANTGYLGQAAHCAGTGGNTETDGCLAGTLPVGTPVEV